MAPLKLNQPPLVQNSGMETWFSMATVTGPVIAYMGKGYGYMVHLVHFQWDNNGLWFFFYHFSFLACNLVNGIKPSIQLFVLCIVNTGWSSFKCQ